MVESFDLDDQAVLTGHQFVLQLGHLSLIGRLCQVVAQDVDQQVKQDHAGGERKKASGIKRGGGRGERRRREDGLSWGKRGI